MGKKRNCMKNLEVETLIEPEISSFRSRIISPSNFKIVLHQRDLKRDVIE